MLRRESSHIAPVPHLNKSLANLTKSFPSGVSHRDSDYKVAGVLYATIRVDLSTAFK